jgi:hypothetical protein
MSDTNEYRHPPSVQSSLVTCPQPHFNFNRRTLLLPFKNTTLLRTTLTLDQVFTNDLGHSRLRFQACQILFQAFRSKTSYHVTLSLSQYTLCQTTLLMTRNVPSATPSTLIRHPRMSIQTSPPQAKNMPVRFANASISLVDDA